MDQQSVDDVECTARLNKKTLCSSFTVFLRYTAYMKIFIHPYILIANYTDNMQLTHIDYLHTARVDCILRVKYEFDCNYCSEIYVITFTVLYKRYLDGTAINLGLLFFL